MRRVVAAALDAACILVFVAGVPWLAAHLQLGIKSTRPDMARPECDGGVRSTKRWRDGSVTAMGATTSSVEADA